MPKTDKELAVDVAIAYINGTAQSKSPNGETKPLLDLKSVTNVIKGIYTTLEGLEAPE